ncbi:MAG: endonuclease domain-containing protein [Patescibacteria group bacterium]
MRTPFKQYKQLINERARQLRNNPTPAEAKFWEDLRRRQFCGLKFLRQHPILFLANNRVHFFLTDFYCHKYKLIIEIDGDIHDKKEQQEYDLMREETLKEMGFKILRFKNEEVVQNIDLVINKLERYI